MRLFGGEDTGGSIYLTLCKPGAMHDSIVLLGMLFSLAGLTFKIAAVPLYFYVADVYQGAASPVTGLLGFIPKFAGFIALIRLFSLCGWAYGDTMFWLLWVLAAATMTVGNTLALMQHNVKRMLAYSSVAHSGYMLVALVAGPAILGGADASPMRNGLSAVLFYMAIYGVMNLGAFSALAFFRKAGPEGEDSAETIQDLGGSARRHPWACLALAVCVLGLMGFPLTSGFLGKVYVFSAALSSGGGGAGHMAVVVLVVLGVINAAIGAAYYLRILASCYLGRSTESITPSRCVALRLGMALCAITVLALFFLPGLLLDRSSRAVGDVPVISRATSGVGWPPASGPR
jgi:NADH-quinone oxidoreductase subunit N